MPVQYLTRTIPCGKSKNWVVVNYRPLERKLGKLWLRCAGVTRVPLKTKNDAGFGGKVRSVWEKIPEFVI